MRVNVEKVLERDQKLSELDNRAGMCFFIVQSFYKFLGSHKLFMQIHSFYLEALQVGASRFEQSAGKLKNKYWWANMKVRFIVVLYFYFRIVFCLSANYQNYNNYYTKHFY